MKNIFVIGAGRTATALIEYLLTNSSEQNWNVTVGDFDLELAEHKIQNYLHGKAIKFNALDNDQRSREIEKSDIVISFLPPTMHEIIARECLKHKTHLVTASYVSQGMSELDSEVKNNGLIFLNEMGLDPGIDHMDAMTLKEKVEKENGKIISLKSFCGALITPESDNNPWHYKFTWSPMNIVLAGQGTVKYKENSRIKSVPYSDLFLNTEKVEVPGLGTFEAYPNRDSVSYIDKYNLNDVKDFYRGTLRRPGYCKAWNALIKLGLTDNEKAIPDSDKLTWRQWVKSFLPYPNGKPVDEEVAEFLGVSSNDEILQKIKWLGLFDDDRIKLTQGTPAKILLDLLMKKWEFQETDRDMVVLQTEIIYEADSKKKKLMSTMSYKGEGKLNTAMTFTGGLPVGIGVKLIANECIKERGVLIPIYKDIYEPVLSELKENGIVFYETETILN
jgi:saccharopine dehydrogenase-like NADP-dependent oxidoreductase